jgi:hypothetical protein
MKGGKSKTRKKATNNLQTKMNEKGFTPRDKKKFKKRVRYIQNINAFTHRLGLSRRKSINEIKNTAFDQQLKKIKTRRAKKSYYKKKIKTRAQLKKKDKIKRNELLNKEVLISLPTPRALSRRTGSRRFSNAITLRRANTI